MDRRYRAGLVWAWMAAAGCVPFDSEKGIRDDAAESASEADKPTSRSTQVGGVDTGGGADGGLETRLLLGCNDRVDCERVVFVTRQRFGGGVLGGADGADRICSEIASRSTTLPRVRDRQFRSWISTSTESASDRLVHGTAAYVRPDGTPVATDWDQLVSGSHLAPINLTEDGRIVGAEAGSGTQVWTGTSITGVTLDPMHLCDDWLNDTVGWVGNCDAVGHSWTNRYGYTCSDPGARLYCVEQ